MSIHDMYAEQKIAAVERDLLEAHGRIAKLESLAERLEQCRWREQCARCPLVDGCDFESEFDELGLYYGGEL